MFFFLDMPGIVVFRRRWSVGSDDLIVPGVFLFTIHLIWWVFYFVLNLIITPYLGWSNRDIDTGSLMMMISRMSQQLRQRDAEWINCALLVIIKPSKSSVKFSSDPLLIDTLCERFCSFIFSDITPILPTKNGRKCTLIHFIIQFSFRQELLLKKW